MIKENNTCVKYIVFCLTYKAIKNKKTKSELCYYLLKNFNPLQIISQFNPILPIPPKTY